LTLDVFACVQREFVQLVIDGVEALIKMEKRLEEGESIDDLVPASAEDGEK